MRRIPSLWVRLAALAVLLIVLLVGMVGLALKAVRPYHEAGVEAGRLAATRRQIAGLTRANNALQRQVSYLNTPDGIASEAHGMGYLRPGEIPLVIEGPPAQAVSGETPPAAAAPAPPAAPHSDSLLRRFWHHLLDL